MDLSFLTLASFHTSFHDCLTQLMLASCPCHLAPNMAPLYSHNSLKLLAVLYYLLPGGEDANP